MNNPGAEGCYKTVAVYEMLGQAALVYAVIVSGGHWLAGPLTLMIFITVGGPVSGGHANASQTIASFILYRKFERDFWMAIVMILAQAVGCFLGLFLSWTVLMPTERDPVD